MKTKRSNKCYTKCSKFFWFKRKNNWSFRDYSVLLAKIKTKAKYRIGLKILTPK